MRINPDGSHTFTPHNPEQVYTYIGGKYDPNIDLADCDRLLECLEPQQREIFIRTIAAALCLPLARLKMSRVKGLLCHGDGSNGKDTLRAALVAVLGRGVTGKSLGDFRSYDTGRKFPLAGLENSLCNWSSENADAVKLDKLQSLKQFITGDELTIEHKGRGEYPYKPEAIFLANCNLLPSISSDAEAIRSRYCILSFKKTYVVGASAAKGELEADPRFKEDPNFVLERIAPALLNRMLERIPLLLAEGINYSSSDAALRKAQEKSQHLWQFVRDMGYEVGQGERVYAKDLWQELQDWYQEAGILEIEHNLNSNQKLVWNDLPNQWDKPVKAPNQLYARFCELFPRFEKYRHTERVSESGAERTMGEVYYLGICKQSAEKSEKSSSAFSAPYTARKLASALLQQNSDAEDGAEATILTQRAAEDAEATKSPFAEICNLLSKLTDDERRQLAEILTPPRSEVQDELTALEKETVAECAEFIREAIKLNDPQTAQDIQASLAEQSDAVKSAVWGTLTAGEKAAFKALLSPESKQSAPQKDAPTPPQSKPARSKKPFNVGEMVVVAYSELPFYRGVKGEIVSVQHLSTDPQQQVTMLFDKPVKGAMRDTFPASDLLRAPN